MKHPSKLPGRDGQPRPKAIAGTHLHPANHTTTTSSSTTSRWPPGRPPRGQQLGYDIRIRQRPSGPTGVHQGATTGQRHQIRNQDQSTQASHKKQITTTTRVLAESKRQQHNQQQQIRWSWAATSTTTKDLLE